MTLRITATHMDDKRRLLQRYQYRWLVLIAGILAYAISHLTRWSYAGITTYLAQDLHIDNRGLGLLGASFFYAYALAQIPWGILTDRYGGRITVTAGGILIAVCLFGFATSTGLTQVVIWRAVIGGMSAAAYVPVAGIMSRWFTPRERGLSHVAYAGLGGGLGEVMAFLLLPVMNAGLHKGYNFLGYNGWRGATMIIALIILGMSVVCWLLLRSKPEDKGLPTIQALTQLREAGTMPAPTGPEVPIRTIVKDPMLWLFSVLFSGFIVALRLVPGWLPAYGTDLYIDLLGFSVSRATIAGGVLGTLFVVGRAFGTPVVGKLSDLLVSRGISRVALMTAGIFLAALLFWFLSLDLPSTLVLGTIAALMGIAINLFPLMNAAVTEVWGIGTTGVALGVINTVAQLTGASVLAISGYVGVQLGNWTSALLSQYRSIWYLGMVCCAGAGLAGVVCEWRGKACKGAEGQGSRGETA